MMQSQEEIERYIIERLINDPDRIVTCLECGAQFPSRYSWTRNGRQPLCEPCGRGEKPKPMTPIDAMLNAVEWKQLEGDPPADDDGLPYATHEGVLTIGNIELKCYQLNDGTRLFDAESVHCFFGGAE